MAYIRSSVHRVSLVVVLVPVVLAQVRFIAQPVDITVKEGTPMATISCQVTDLDTSSQVMSFERDDHVISDETNVRRPILDDMGLDSDDYKVKLDINAGTGSRWYRLSIDEPSRNDTGRFRCIVCRRSSSGGTSKVACDANHIFASSDEITLTVNYPPADYYPVCEVLASSSPVSTESNASFVTVVEGQPTRLACSSEIASPPVRIAWYRDGVEVRDGAVVVSNGEDGIRVSRLDLTPVTGRDNGTVFTCTATSDAFNETSLNCSLLPLNVLPPGDGPAPGHDTSAYIVIIILACIVVILLIAIGVAYYFRRIREQRDSSGHKVEYIPAELTD